MGVYCVAAGGALVVFFKNTYLRGVLPVPVFGGCVGAFGAWCLLNPTNAWLRARTGRLLARMRGE